MLPRSDARADLGIANGRIAGLRVANPTTTRVSEPFARRSRSRLVPMRLLLVSLGRIGSPATGIASDLASCPGVSP